MWVIITRDNCSFCEKAKELLRSQNKQFKVFNVQDMENKWVLTMLKASGLTTVPQIFRYDGAFVGGYTELKQLITEGPL
jgi:thioredoxin reductase (NADPH)